MKKNMTLNKIIKTRAGEEQTMLTSRYDKQALKELKYNLNHKPLSIFDFMTLADIYNVHYTVTLTVLTEDKYHISVIKKEDFSIGSINEFVVQAFPHVNKLHYDAFMTLDELNDYLSSYHCKLEIK